MTREEAKQIALEEVEKGIRKYGENAIFVISPKIGKDCWTWKEAKEAILEDKALEDSGNYNLIDSILKYDEYKKVNFKKGNHIRNKYNGLVYVVTEILTVAQIP